MILCIGSLNHPPNHVCFSLHRKTAQSALPSSSCSTASSQQSAPTEVLGCHGGWARQSSGGLPDPLLPAMRSSAKATERERERGERDEPVLRVAGLGRSPDTAGGGDVFTGGRVSGVGRLRWGERHGYFAGLFTLSRDNPCTCPRGWKTE
jgi:hypothetical protein